MTSSDSADSLPAPEPVGAEAAAQLAALHEAAFALADTWDAAAIELLLAMPGTFGLWWPGTGFILVRTASVEAEVLTLAVAPQARRRGLGRRLVQAAAALSVQRGAEVMFLEVGATNEGARALYESLGCFPVGRRLRYYSDGTDALVMQMDLPRRS